MRITLERGGGRLDRLLAERFPTISRATVMKYLKEGHARLNGRRARPGLRVQAGDELELRDWEASIERIRSGAVPGLPALPRTRPEGIAVLYQDEQLVVVDKPAGLVMHPGKGHEHEGLDQILREHFGKSTRLVHRIDRDTSGVVVAARGHPDSARRLAAAFEAGEARKSYLALVRGVPEPDAGTIDAPLLDTKREGSRVQVDPKGKPAVTEYETLEAFRAFAWLRARPRTGRRHQIRAHLEHIGHPLAVDHVYAGRRRLKASDLRPDLKLTWRNPFVLRRQPLHAESIALRHPKSGEEMTFSAPPARDLEAALDLLRATSGRS